MSHRSLGRRIGSAAVGTALMVSGLSVGGPAPLAHGHDQTDPVPAELAAAWLAGEDGTRTGFGGFSWGASIDAALALDAVPGHRDDVEAITAALADHITDYVTGEGFGDAGSTYAGATAKAAVFTARVGEDPTSFGGEDLVDRLEGTVQSSGRIEDISTYGDYANVIGQSFAARALAEAGSGDADVVLDFLLAQQCGPGWFRQDFTRLAPPNDWTPGAATDGGCVTSSDTPNVDATALAILQLHPLAAVDPDVAVAVDEGIDWLVGQQGADGALRLGSIPPNANSTGVAGAAFVLTGEHEAAEKAAAWLRGLQFSGTRCDGAAQPEIGAVAYTPADFRTAQSEGVTDRAKVARAVSQSIHALQAAPRSKTDVSLQYPSFLNGGGRARVKVFNLAPGEPGCVGIGRFTKRVVGTVGAAERDFVAARVQVPNRTGFVPVVADTADNSVGSEGVALAAAKLRVALKAAVSPRRTQRVVVRGLFAGERVVVRHAGKRLARGVASNKGRFVVTFDAPRAAKRYRVTAVGQFADRAGRAGYRVR